MADLKGRTVLITGATSGMGEAAAISLARQGARVLAVGRNPARGAAVVEQLRQLSGSGEFMEANLLSLKDIDRLAEEVLAHSPTLDVLINNAGGTFRTRTMSADGIEATFALNTVAAFALANRLKGALAQSQGRVVNIATGFLGRTRLKVNELVNPSSYSAWRRYSHTKLALIMVTLEQADRWQSEGISAVAVQPGIVQGTRFGGREPAGPSLWQRSGARMMQLMGIGATLEQATERYQKAAFGELASGTYLAWGKIAKIPAQAQEAGIRQELWQLLEKLDLGRNGA